MSTIKHIVLFASIAALVSCGGAEERKSVYLEKAMQSMQAGDYDKARIELKNVLQIDPKDAAAYFQLGKVFEAKQDFRKAFGNYSKAVELAPDNTEYLAKIGRFYLILAGDADKAQEQLEKIEAIDPQSRDGLLLKAGILSKRGDSEQALAIVEKLQAADTGDEEVASFLAILYGQQKRAADAVRVLQQALDSHPGNTGLRTRLAAAYIMDDKRDQAEQTLKAVLRQEPEVFNHYLNLARFYQQENRLDDAIAILEEAVRNDEDDITRKMALISLLKEKKGIDAAIAQTARFAANDSNAGKLLLAEAALHLDNKDPDTALATYQRVIDNYSDEDDGVAARVAMASVLAGRKQYDKAQSLIDDAVQVSPNDTRVNLASAKLALIRKDYEKAVIALRNVIKDNPENLDAYMMLAQSHRALGDEAQAEDTLQRAYENNRGNVANMKKLAGLYARAGKAEKAENIVDDALALAPQDYDLLTLKAAMLSGRKQYAEAAELGRRMIRIEPAKADGYRYAATTLIEQKQFDEAEQLLKQGYEKTADHALLASLARIRLGLGDAAGAISLLEPVVAAKGKDDESLTMMLAQAQLANGQQDKAVSLLESALAEHPDWEQAVLAMTRVAGQKGIDAAIAQLEQGVKNNPDSIKLRVSLASLYERKGDADGAIAQYEAVLGLQQDNLIATNNLAALLVDHRSDEASLKRALELAEKLKVADKPVLNDTIGWVYYRNGMYQQAVDILKKVVEASPKAAIFNYHLGMALVKSGDKAAAKPYLQTVVDSEANFAGKDEARRVLDSL